MSFLYCESVHICTDISKTNLKSNHIQKMIRTATSGVLGTFNLEKSPRQIQKLLEVLQMESGLGATLDLQG